MNICIIDDDEIFQFATQRLIEITLGDQVGIHICEDGEEAITYLRETDEKDFPDIIFLDINMPKMNGFEFLLAYVNEELYEKKAVKIYVVSSSVDPQDIQHAKSHPYVSEYVKKPINKEKIFKIAEEFNSETT